MNIFIFELKSQIKSTAIWTITIIALLITFQSGIYPIFSDSLDDIMDLINGFPKAFLSAFGFDSETMLSFGGFFNMTYSYLALVGAIMASFLSITAFSREKRSKCSDFLLAKPCKRSTVFISKFMSILILISVSSLLTILTAAIIYSENNTKKLILSLIGLFLTELVFIALGTLFAVLTKKIHSVSGIATAFGFGAFVLSALYGIFNEEAMKFLTPFKYFEPSAVYANGGFEVKYAVTASIIIIFCICTACYRYCRTDAHAV